MAFHNFPSARIRSKFGIRLQLVFIGLFLAVPISVPAQTETPATNAPNTNAPAASPPAAVAPGDIVSRAQEDTAKLLADRSGLNPDATIQETGDKLPSLTQNVDDQIAEDSRLLASTPTLNNLERSQIGWRSLTDSFASTQKSLSARVGELDNLLWQMRQMDDTWKVTLDAAKKNNTPVEIQERINQVRALITETTKAVQADLAPLYSMQNLVAAQAARTQTGLDTITKAADTARNELFTQDHPALWNPASLTSSGLGVVHQERLSLNAQFTALQTYLREKIGAVLVHLFMLAVFLMGFFWLRKTVSLRAKEEPSLQLAAQVFDVPLATALLLALLATWFLYPDAPRLLWSVVGAAALVPAVVVIRRLIDPANFFILYATVIAYFTDQVRHVVTQNGVLLRFLFILELLAVSIFAISALRASHLAASSNEPNRLKRFTRIYLHFAFLVFVFAGLANVFGYVHLSILAGDAMLESSYWAVILYAMVRIGDALGISALSVRPISSLGMVRRHQDLIFRNLMVATRWLVFAIWLLLALQLFTLLNPLWQATNQVLWAEYKWFSIPFSLGAVLAFPITIWAAFLISRFVRFVLEEELYPHLQLGRGIPYAASTMVHYAILFLGFFAAVAATGVQISQFAFLAGAFGVGLGFGLQNIMNNFVSGIILLFERPIKVGDTIQIDAATIGRVESIGIRASVILLTNGSELIMPNGNLISNPVTNWTLSNCERLIEIPVNISTKIDPQHVMNLLVKVAKANPNVIKNPSPQALLASPGGASQAFRLRAWTDSEDEWMKVTSDLSLAINDALAKENIAMT